MHNETVTHFHGISLHSFCTHLTAADTQHHWQDWWHLLYSNTSLLSLSSSTTHALYLSAFLPNLYVLPLSLSTLLLLSFSLSHFPSLLILSDWKSHLPFLHLSAHHPLCFPSVWQAGRESCIHRGPRFSKSSSTSLSLAIFTQITGDINKLFDFPITSNV